MPITVGSLFAGVGGICKGFQQASTDRENYELLWANEIDEFACETYRLNFNHLLLEGDIEKILRPERVDEEITNKKAEVKNCSDKKKKEELQKELDKLVENRDAEMQRYTGLHNSILAQPIDVLNGGFPCQAFSIAGEQRGFDDPRGNLFLSIVDLIEQLGERFTTYDKKGNIVVNGKPRVLFLENVRNLQEHDNKRTYRIIKERLEKCGYTIYEKVLNTMDYTDLPQNRERIYIIGFRDEQDATRFHFFDKDVLSQHEVHKSSKDRANDVKRIINYGLTAQTAGKYYYTRAKYPHYFVTEEEFTGSAKEIRVNLEEQVDEMYQFYQCRRGQYVRKNKSDVCPTLTANMGTGGHNVPLIRVKDGIRKITPEEAFKLQGFPVGNGYQLPTTYKGKVYSDSHLYKQAGNAVSVPMIRMLAQAILEIIQ